MKFVKLASATGVLAAVLFVGCGQSGGDVRPPSSVAAGSLQTGAVIRGLLNDQTHQQWMCMRYDLLFQAPNSTTWAKAASSQWKCGAPGAETVLGGYNTCKYTGGANQQGYRYFVEYEIAFCDSLASSPPQSGSPCNVGDSAVQPVMRSRAAAKGTCPTDFSDAKAIANVQFDNKGPWGGGVDPQVDVNEVCWNYKLDVPVTCIQQIAELDQPLQTQCVRFGLIMGPPHCGDTPHELPSSYCVMGHEDFNAPLEVGAAGQTSPLIDPILSYLLTDQHLGHTWAEFYLAFKNGVNDRAGLELYQAPWLLFVNNTGLLADWQGNGLKDRIINFNRGVDGSSTGFPASYRTAGSWHYSNGGTTTAGVITAGYPSYQNTLPPGLGTTFLIWDTSPTCDVAPSATTIPQDAHLARWNGPHAFNGNCSATGGNATSIIKGVIQTGASTFDIVYACVLPSWLGETGEVLDTANITQLYKLGCDASGTLYAPFMCDCKYSSPGWYEGSNCTPNFVPDP